MDQVLAVQLPAVCPLACGWCRTPKHGDGDPKSILRFVRKRLSEYREIYLTSNGETGFSPVFEEIVDFAQAKGVRVSVLCATEKSIVRGLCRAEISLNEYTKCLALRAIEKARRLGNPFVISTVDDGSGDIDPESIAEEHGASGAIVRALQKEGRSSRATGTTRIYQRPGSKLGCFPVSAYAELVGYGEAATCIDHFGRAVPLLGNSS